MPANEEMVNEYLLDAYGLKKHQVEKLEETLKACREEIVNLSERYNNTLHAYADVCRRVDRLQAAGDNLVAVMDELASVYALDDNYIQKSEDAMKAWGEKNV